MSTKNWGVIIILACAFILGACAVSTESLATGTPIAVTTTVPFTPSPTLTLTQRPEKNVAEKKPVKVSASWVVDPPERAVDGNLSNWWGAGGTAPQWIEVDLQGLYTISRIQVINQGPSGDVIPYRVLGRGAGFQYQLLHTFDGMKTENQILGFTPNPPWKDISVVRVEIPSGSGWVGLREIRVFSREDPKPLPVAARPDTPLPQTGVDWDILEPINPDNAIMLQQLSLVGQGTINDLVWSPDGKTIAAASTVGVWLYDAANLNAPPRFLEGHTRNVLSVAFVPGEGTLLSASQDGTVKVWDVVSGDLVRTFQLWDNFSHEVGTAPREPEVWSVAFSQDGSQLAAGYYDGAIRFWDIAKRYSRIGSKQHSGQVSQLVFSPDGKTLASSSFSGELFLWDVDTREPRFVLEGHPVFSGGLAFSPDGAMLASGGLDSVLWDTGTGALIKVMPGHTGEVLSIAFGPNGQTLASGGRDNELVFHDVSSATSNAAGEKAGLIKDMAFDPNGARLAAITGSGVLQLWVPADGRLIQSRVIHGSPINSISFSPTGQYLASGSDDSMVRIWDIEKNSLYSILAGHQSKVNSVAFSSDGRTLVSGSFDGTLRLWDVETASLINVLKGHQSMIQCVAFSPNSKIVASGSTDQTVRLWDVATGMEIASLKGHKGEVEVLDFSRNGSWLLSGSADGTLRIWDVASGSELGVLDGNLSYVIGAAFSPDASLISSVGGDFILRAFEWSLTEGQVTSNLKFPEIGTGGWDMATTFSPNGMLIASAANFSSAYWVTPGEIRLYRSDIGFPVNLLRGPTRRVMSVAFSPDGRLLASGSADGTVRLWGVIHDPSWPEFQPTIAPPTWTPTRTVPTLTPTATVPTLTPTLTPTLDLPKSGNLALNMPVTASNGKQYPARNAVDGNLNTSWGAGAMAPQWIEINLGAPATVTEIKLLVGQYPNGKTEHRLLAGSTQNALVDVHMFDGYTHDVEWLYFKPETPLKDVQFIRVETKSSPSWVAWFEIEVIGSR